MTFEIEINDRRSTVSVERAGRRFRVIVDGRPHDVDAVRCDTFGLSLLLDGDAGTSRDVQIAPAGDGSSGQLLVRIDGRAVAATVNGRRMRRGGAHAGAGTDGEQTIAAPMPGRVVRVLVAPGDVVAARQPVVVVEAMKMENELRAPRPGIVSEVHVSEGMSVEAQATLVVIE
jgi:biotin carboxyl carrier protein